MPDCTWARDASSVDCFLPMTTAMAIRQDPDRAIRSGILRAPADGDLSRSGFDGHPQAS